MTTSSLRQLLIICVLICCFQRSSASPQVDALTERIRNRIEAAGYPPLIEIQGELIYASQALPAFYEQRGFAPAWSDGTKPLPRVQTLINAIHEGLREALSPNDYHITQIRSINELFKDQKNLPKQDRFRLLVDLELLCTDAFLVYGSHLLAGRVNPETIDAEWQANRRDADIGKVLSKALADQEIGTALRNLLPEQTGYWRLRQALTDYRDIRYKGGWPAIPEGPKLQPGMTDQRVSILIQRLQITGDLQDIEADSNFTYDSRIENAVKAFQKRHGLEPIGYVGPQTLAALNVPARDRIRQIEINLERWRWLPQDLGKKHIIVNIADFRLFVVEEDSSILEMRVVVGRDYRRTPVFSDKMTYLVFCPYWNVPPGITINDVLPAIKKDPGYLASKNIRVFKGWDVNTVEIDPYTVDWSKVSGKNLQYRFRQDPGATNSLGHVKFMFPNKFKVYLHDTPAKELFEKQDR
ncbi:L,D-transpeptidase family protein, partial [bacterium]|nr:L,D-transpeptidase family protein [bacterium]